MRTFPEVHQLEQKPDKKPWHLSSEGRQTWAFPGPWKPLGRKCVQRLGGLCGADVCTGPLGVLKEDPGEQVVTFTPFPPDKRRTASPSDSGVADPHKTEPDLTCRRVSADT